MVKCASLCTREIDNKKAAFNEIKTQLDGKLALLKNSVGIIMCHPEFIISGTAKYICENLPFDLVGITTASQVVNGCSGELLLTIFVMTSDDVWFKTGLTAGLEEEIEEPVKIALETAIAGETQTQKLALVFPPLITKYSGDSYVYAVQKIIPNVPIFGALAIDDTFTFEYSETIYKGQNYKTSMPFILCYGNINPRFIVGTFPEEKAMPYKGEVTKSNGCFVSKINNINANKYFEGIGLLTNGVIADNFILLPFSIDQKTREDYDGIPVIRGIAFFTEDGTAVFRGDVDEGSTFSMLTCETDDVLAVTRSKIEQVNALTDINGVLLFPCIARRMMTMYGNSQMEIEAIKNSLHPEIPFMMGYAGGEISPTQVRDGIPTNRYHNYSLVILVI